MDFLVTFLFYFFSSKRRKQQDAARAARGEAARARGEIIAFVPFADGSKCSSRHEPSGKGQHGGGHDYFSDDSGTYGDGF